MGFVGNKSIVYTKNKFEAYLNSEQSNKDNFWIGIITDIDLSGNNLGSKLRRKDKTEFDRQYMIWLNTK